MIIKKLKDTIKRRHLFIKGDKVVVGVSGGPDSVALLYALNSLKKELGLKLHIAHLDHMLRRESNKDREFVQNLASRLKIPVTWAKVNVKALAKKGSLEEIARDQRLGFLFKVAKEIKAKKIALAHNLDDQAETVLMRILRGTGLYGLSAILPKRKIRGFEIIRPLIEIRRTEIETYLKKKKIKPRRDASNAQDIYFRNKIRNKLLPLLEKEYSLNIKELLTNLAESAAYDYDYLNKTALSAHKRLGRKINLARFLRLHPAVRRLVLRLNIARIKGNTRRIGMQHIKELEDLILNRPVNSIVDLPAGVSVAKKKQYFYFFNRI
jgi:tRNA(Ile)-lysidine synthase